MPLLIKPTVEITILDDSHPEECQAGCGIDWSSPEAQALARQQIKNRFGNEIKFSYLKLSNATASGDMLQWEEEIRKKNLLLPLLLLNGQLRISGLFDIRQLLDTIEAEIEIGR